MCCDLVPSLHSLLLLIGGGVVGVEGFYWDARISKTRRLVLSERSLKEEKKSLFLISDLLFPLSVLLLL